MEQLPEVEQLYAIFLTLDYHKDIIAKKLIIINNKIPSY